MQPSGRKRGDFPARSGRTQRVDGFPQRSSDVLIMGAGTGGLYLAHGLIRYAQVYAG
jgi:hypothetical protein